MGESRIRLDFSRIADVEDLRTVPEGEYPCRVAEVRVSQSPAGHVRWGLRWEVCQGDFAGRTCCWDSLHWTERGMPRAKYLLRLLGFDVEGPLELDPAALEDRQALVLVASEEREDPTTGIRRLTNRVPFSGYRSMAEMPPDAAADRAAE
ncbi:MAG TPA: hypothetical protein VGC54_08000 [Planctomycetota bacterium]